MTALGMMYNMKGGKRGVEMAENNASIYHHHHHLSTHHPVALNGVEVGLGVGNQTDPGVDDPGGMGFGNWSDCITIDPTMNQPTTALFQFIVNGLGISIVAVLGTLTNLRNFLAKRFSALMVKIMSYIFLILFYTFPGIFGNALSAVVLSRPQMKSSVTCLLLGLAFCDTLLISVSILVFSMPFLNDYVHSSFLWKYENIYFRLWVPYLYPVSITGKGASWILHNEMQWNGIRFGKNRRGCGYFARLTKSLFNLIWYSNRIILVRIPLEWFRKHVLPSTTCHAQLFQLE